MPPRNKSEQQFDHTYFWFGDLRDETDQIRKPTELEAACTAKFSANMDIRCYGDEDVVFHGYYRSLDVVIRARRRSGPDVYLGTEIQITKEIETFRFESNYLGELNLHQENGEAHEVSASATDSLVQIVNVAQPYGPVVTITRD